MHRRDLCKKDSRTLRRFPDVRSSQSLMPIRKSGNNRQYQLVLSGARELCQLLAVASCTDEKLAYGDMPEEKGSNRLPAYSLLPCSRVYRSNKRPAAHGD